MFLAWLIEHERWPGVRAALYAHRTEAKEIDGVAFFARHVVLQGSAEATRAFAATARRRPRERMIVAPVETVETYWDAVKSWHLAPRVVRARQPVLVVDRDRLRGDPGGVIVRRARPEEWDEVARNSAAMIREELEYDPRTPSGEFDANVRATIERGFYWVGEANGELCFFCSAGAFSEHTLQLQGIWTPPHLRGRGFATKALYQVCNELLDDVPTISLYVNDFNHRALALYARLGFQEAGAFRTLLF